MASWSEPVKDRVRSGFKTTCRECRRATRLSRRHPRISDWMSEEGGNSTAWPTMPATDIDQPFRGQVSGGVDRVGFAGQVLTAVEVSKHIRASRAPTISSESMNSSLLINRAHTSTVSSRADRHSDRFTRRPTHITGRRHTTHIGPANRCHTATPRCRATAHTRRSGAVTSMLCGCRHRQDRSTTGC